MSEPYYVSAKNFTIDELDFLEGMNSHRICMYIHDEKKCQHSLFYQTKFDWEVAEKNLCTCLDEEKQILFKYLETEYFNKFEIENEGLLIYIRKTFIPEHVNLTVLIPFTVSTLNGVDEEPFLQLTVSWKTGMNSQYGITELSNWSHLIKDVRDLRKFLEVFPSAKLVIHRKEDEYIIRNKILKKLSSEDQLYFNVRFFL